MALSKLPAVLIVSLFPASIWAGDASRVLIVVNDSSPLSRSVGEYYARARGVPAQNLCHLRTTTNEEIDRSTFNRDVAGPIAQFLRKANLVDSIYYIVTTAGVPLKISGTANLDGDCASVDSELAPLYSDMKTGRPHPIRGSIPNPFFGRKDRAFTHPEFPMYLVTRLAAYDFDEIKAMIDRAAMARNQGKFVIDLKSATDQPGDNWLRTAAILLPKDRVILDASEKVLYNQTDVIGYAGWGSNDPSLHRRTPGFKWLPGAIMTEYVSTDGRTFARPPASWNVSGWNTPKLWFAGSPQSLSADYIEEGVTGVSGHVYEPYLIQTPRPDILLPAYYNGRNLAESYYLAIRSLSWQNIVVGDPLCEIGKPHTP